jgi:hypothetical protein
MKVLIGKLEEIAVLQARVKQRSMVYQPTEKERCAERDGLPHDAYYDLPYGEWAAIRDRRENE